ncbi:MAG: STAS domain-containing protein [Betaproteobacteria bacterium]|nr:STAS domain-containing protein [Betaproteobacteria bacterium]
MVNISRKLSAASAAPLAALRKTIERYDGVQFDFSRFEGADVDGCQHLRLVLKSLARAGKSVSVTNPDSILASVSAQTTAGDALRDQSPWLLKIELMRILGRPSEFEEVAVDYAVTYDVSPPSWPDDPVAVTRRNGSRSAPTDACVAKDDVIAPADELLSRIRIHAARYRPLIVDLSRARRMDFVSASQFVKLLTELGRTHKDIEIRGANEMISTLLVMMGLGDVARITPRR